MAGTHQNGRLERFKKQDKCSLCGVQKCTYTHIYTQTHTQTHNIIVCTILYSQLFCFAAAMMEQSPCRCQDLRVTHQPLQETHGSLCIASSLTPHRLLPYSPKNTPLTHLLYVWKSWHRRKCVLYCRLVVTLIKADPCSLSSISDDITLILLFFSFASSPKKYDKVQFI